MTTAIRYKWVTNTTGAPLTAAGVPSGDGDDKTLRIIQRQFSAADIGVGAGQTRDASGAPYEGCILDVLDPGVQVLAIYGFAFKTEGLGIYLMDGNIDDQNPPAISTRLIYTLDPNNVIRVLDGGGSAQVQLAANDLLILHLVLGTGVNWLDID